MTVTYSEQPGYAWIDLDDGKVNAFSREAFSGLNAALDEAEAARRIAVIRGRPGIFSAGFHLGELSAGPDSGRELLRLGADLCCRLLSFPVPTICVCTGHAFPMGAFVLMSSDFRIGVHGDYQLGMNEVRINLTVPAFALVLARSRLQPTYFHRTAITGELFTPEQAQTAGMIDAVVDTQALTDSVCAKVERFNSIDFEHHHATKLRANGPLIANIQAGLSEDLGRELSGRDFAPRGPNG